MKLFGQLIKRVDETTATTEKVEALFDYFGQPISDRDKLWVVAIFSHRRPPRGVSSSTLRSWVAEITTLPDWLIEDTYHTVGDLAETLALVLPYKSYMTKTEVCLTQVIEDVAGLKAKTEEDKKQMVLNYWEKLDAHERFLFNKLITGGFRIGVSQALLAKALAKHLEMEEKVVSHRLMGNWSPTNTTWHEMFIATDSNDEASKPYPFLLAYAVENDGMALGNASEWAIEHKWDGIRAQVIKRNGHLYIWSRGEELITDKFPEISKLESIALDNFVLDGELLAYQDRPLNFQLLQTRIGRKKVSKNNLKECPVVFYAYDLLELDGQDFRSFTFEERRLNLEKLVENIQLPDLIKLSKSEILNTWDEIKDKRINASKYHAEGVMLKHIKSTYEQGRKTGLWWKWKIDPYRVDAVMIYAQKGHGRRANLFTDFTFAIWNTNEDGKRVLVPFTKAYTGLKDVEFEEITQFVKKNTIDKFGPVYSVKAELVFELAFEGVAFSKRHKCGIALRFPRIAAWRMDKKIEEADELSTLVKMIKE
jgi:DNA ligase 1